MYDHTERACDRAPEIGDQYQLGGERAVQLSLLVLCVGLPEQAAYSFGPFPGFLQRGVGHDHQELLAAVTADDVVLARLGLQQQRQRFEHHGASLVAVGIVE